MIRRYRIIKSLNGIFLGNTIGQNNCDILIIIKLWAYFVISSDVLPSYRHRNDDRERRHFGKLHQIINFKINSLQN